MKNHIHDTCKLDIELVPSRCHRCNTAKVAICNFKAYFLSVSAGVANNFSPNLWDQLLPQTKITINLIWQSNATPNVLAYAHLSGPFDYNKIPLTSMGCEAQVHEKLTNAEHGHIIQSTDGISSHLQNILHTPLSYQVHQEQTTI
jgi:hypothetical protein